MNRLRSFAVFLYDFVVGDDPTVAVGVVITFALVAALVATGLPAWWLPVVAIPVLLAVGLARAVRASRREESSGPS